MSFDEAKASFPIGFLSLVVLHQLNSEASGNFSCFSITFPSGSSPDVLFPIGFPFRHAVTDWGRTLPAGLYRSWSLVRTSPNSAVRVGFVPGWGWWMQ